MSFLQRAALALTARAIPARSALARRALATDTHSTQPSQPSQQQQQQQQAPLDPRLVSVLVCPISRGPLRLDTASNELVSDTAGVAFPIVNGIPHLIPEDARFLNLDPTSPKKEDV